MSESGRLDIERYIPHRRPTLLVDEIVSVSDEDIVCLATLRPDCIWAIPNDAGALVVSPLAMIEVVAQTCAAMVGVKMANDRKPPKLGFLIGCREATFLVPWFAIGDTLRIQAAKTFGQADMVAFTGTVTVRDQVCATLHLSAYDGELAAVVWA